MCNGNRGFNFGRAYRLIPTAEIHRAINCIQGHKPGCEAYAKMRYVRFLSVPVFNRDHTRALVAISRACGGLLRTTAACRCIEKLALDGSANRIASRGVSGYLKFMKLQIVMSLAACLGVAADCDRVGGTVVAAGAFRSSFRPQGGDLQEHAGVLQSVGRAHSVGRFAH